ncbi:MAG: polyphosphate glucokinase [Proteobacteria bacterium]|nr:polyphosphate glucokinase [Pseudomonadota bacterium]
MRLLGIDTGGSSLKAAPVDVTSGVLAADVVSFPTPAPATPAAIAGVVKQIGAAFPDVSGNVGFAFPSVVTGGIARTAANVDKAWIGTDGARLVREAMGRPAAFLNDADAAGLAEVRVGAGRGQDGTVIMLTFGTGIGSAIFHDGHLVPNTEFGHMEIRGMEAEHRASARVRALEQLSWQVWSERVNEVLARMHALFWPELFILGGGVVENWASFGPLLESPARIVPAELGNTAGIVGAALAASEL